VQILALTPSAGTGEYIMLEARTNPGVPCVVELYTSAGTVHSYISTEKVADDSGYVAWKWSRSSFAVKGEWRLTVKATLFYIYDDPLARAAANNAIARGGDPNGGSAPLAQIQVITSGYVTIE
jgi:hypothetical protein